MRALDRAVELSRDTPSWYGLFMNDRRKPAPPRRYCHAVAIGSALATVVVLGAQAQTLTSPNSPSPKAPSTAQTKPSAPPAKTPPTPARSCSIYGEGFVPVPGTDTCVKAGGYLRTDTVISR